jgi:hypothetical protein
MYDVSVKWFGSRCLWSILKVFCDYIMVILELTVYPVKLTLLAVITPRITAFDGPISAASRVCMPPRGTESNRMF